MSVTEGINGNSKNSSKDLDIDNSNAGDNNLIGSSTYFDALEECTEGKHPDSEPGEEIDPVVCAEQSVKSLTDQVEPQYLKDPVSPRKSYSRLCGYLNKQGNRNIIKTFRRRWFVFAENNCKLYYYRTPNDQVPLGDIDISQASFYFNVSNVERPGLFHISVPGRDYFLEAKDRQASLFWLQELQKWRRMYSLHRTQQIGSKSSISDPLVHQQSGLLARSPIDVDLSEEAVDDAPLMLPIDCPGDVGDEAALNATNKRFSVAHQKFNVLRDQVLHSVASIRQSKSYGDMSSPSTPTTELLVDLETTKAVKSISQPECHEEKLSPSSVDTDFSTTSVSAKSRTPGLSAFRLKLSESFRRARLGGENDKAYITRKRTDENVSCTKCNELQNKMESLSDEIVTVQDELNASRDIIDVLHQQLDIVLKEKEMLSQLQESEFPKGNHELLCTKDQQLTELKYKCQKQTQEIEALGKQIALLQKTMKELEQNKEIFEELLQQKDKIIMSLTNELFDIETERRQQEWKEKTCIDSFVDLTKSSDSVQDFEDKESLKDALHAFELQNKFLNKEILELNQLRRYGEEREEKLLMKCSEWEARSCQIQSKLLYLLNELDKPPADSGSRSHDVISRLLQEAMGESTVPESLGTVSWSSEKVYDDLGFNWKWGKEDLLSIKAANLKQRSEDIANKARDVELVSWRVKWDNYIVSLGTKELHRSPELKILVRSGIPREYKGRIWKGCIQMRVKNLRLRLGPNYYESLLATDEFASRIDPASKQIELDLLRTLPNNCHYETLDSDGIPQLRRVLLAYSRHDPSVGYCQGLNRLAAIALLFMDEEDAFWCLVAIVKYIMPDGYYSKTLIGSQVDQRVLKDLMSDKLPRLHAHLDLQKVDLSLFTFNWFLTIFVDNIPVDTYLRVWDSFLYEGSKVLFRYSLAFFKLCESEILQMKDYMTINRFLRNMAEHMTDAKRMSHMVAHLQKGLHQHQCFITLNEEDIQLKQVAIISFLMQMVVHLQKGLHQCFITLNEEDSQLIQITNQLYREAHCIGLFAKSEYCATC